jgi:hypothetical protein
MEYTKVDNVQNEIHTQSCSKNDKLSKGPKT